MTFKILTTSSVFGLLGLMALAPAPAFAQAPADESASDAIVVTAQRRAERQLDVPITVSTLNQQQLETANAQDLTDIAEITPSLRFDRQSQFVQPTIRGIGTAITTAGGGSNVGIYIDGFYSPNPVAADFQLLNVESIQVLKGPQGTLFGRNTTGGAILVQTADPSTEDRAEAQVSYGRYNETRAQIYATYGLTDTVALDIEGLYSRGDGWVKNLFNGEEDGDYEIWSGRIGLKADLTDRLSVLLRYQHGENDDPRGIITNTYVDPVLGPTAANFAPPSAFTTDPDSYNPGANGRYFRSDSNVIQLTVKADLDFADLTSYSQYRKEDADASTDLDQIGLTIFQLGLPIFNETMSQELLLTSKPGTRLQWTAGLFYFKNTDRYVTHIDNGLSATGARIRLGGSSAPTSSYAAFVDMTYELSPQWFVTGGVRYAHDTITDAYYNPVFTGGVKFFVPDLEADKLTPRVVLRYKPTDESSVYVSYTQGYKAGILDVGGATGNPVEPEEVDAYEIGYKYDGDGFDFETAAFYYDYVNLQVSLFRDATAQIINAASSEIYGIEGQARFDVTDNFQVNMGGSYTHAQYKEFNNAPIYLRCPTVAGCGGGTSFFIATGVTLRDVQMQRSPEFTGNIGAVYTADVGGGELAVSGNLYYTSEFFFGPSGNQFPQEGYEVMTLRAQWTDPTDRYDIALWGDNVTDSRYLTQVQYNNFGIGATWSKPVTYGVEVGVRF